MLHSEAARTLYHEYAEGLPIIDYHCHLNPREIAENHRFRSITELWLGGDHYKWRALRWNGVEEHYVTGNATDWEKFQKWAETMPYLMRNPLYHWTHLELKTAFGIDEILKPETAKDIYDECNRLLQKPEYSARGLMERFRVEVVCTTDDPADTLEYHQQIKKEGFAVKVLPAWRADKLLKTEDPQQFVSYIHKLEKTAQTEIRSFQELKNALQKRHDFFASLGCKLSDISLDDFYADDYTENGIEHIFTLLTNGEKPNEQEQKQFKSALLHFYAEMDRASDWTQQYHFGALRNNNTKMFEQLGPDTGYDSVDDVSVARRLAKFLDRLSIDGILGRTILYNLNPKDNITLATMIGNFQKGEIPGQLQLGAAWWFLDQEMGMRRQMNVLSNEGLLSRFVGMLTDSRSFLSYPRHEYFRRILCDLLGEDVESGRLPKSELPRIGHMVEDISYLNAKNYFKF